MAQKTVKYSLVSLSMLALQANKYLSLYRLKGLHLTLMAVGALDKVTSVPAASYRTAGLVEFSRLNMQRIKRARSRGFA